MILFSSIPCNSLQGARSLCGGTRLEKNGLQPIVTPLIVELQVLGDKVDTVGSQKTASAFNSSGTSEIGSPLHGLKTLDIEVKDGKLVNKNNPSQSGSFTDLIARNGNKRPKPQSLLVQLKPSATERHRVHGLVRRASALLLQRLLLLVSMAFSTATLDTRRNVILQSQS